jgi:hypothetical protein
MTMTKAEAKTMREALGLTPPIVAARAGCHANIIWRIESPTSTAAVSESVENALRELAADFDMAAERVALDASQTGIIRRQRTAEGFARQVPELADWPDRTRGLFYAEVQRRAHTGIDYTEE